MRLVNTVPIGIVTLGLFGCASINNTISQKEFESFKKKMAKVEIQVLLPECEKLLGTSEDFVWEAPGDEVQPLNKCIHQYANLDETRELIEASDFSISVYKPTDIQDISKWAFMDQNYPESFAEYLKLVTENAQVPNDFDGQLELAKKGDAVAQYLIAKAYEFGENERGATAMKDEKASIDWYKKSSDQGYAPAMQIWAQLLVSGEYVTTDELQAHEWYKKAAMMGDISSIYKVASNYQHSDFIPKNDAEAKIWYSLLKSFGGEDHFYIPEINLPPEKEIEVQQKSTLLFSEIRNNTVSHCEKFIKNECN